jgi:hypothetical protein
VAPREEFLEMAKVMREFKDPQEISGHYQRWFEFTSATGSRHFVVSPDAEPRLASLEQWRRSQQGGGAAGPGMNRSRLAPAAEP